MYAHVTSSTAQKVDFATLSMCRGLGRQAASDVAAIGSLQRLTPGAALFGEGDGAENVYEVVRGMLRLYKLLPDGRRQITGFLMPGHLLGLAHEGAYLYTAEAVTAVTVCRYPRVRFERLVDEIPGFARRLLAVTSDELRAAQDQMLLLGRKTALEKIASFLLMIAERQDDETAGATVQVPMGRSDIADYLGLTTETVSRTLTKLKRERFIALPNHMQIELRDYEQLEGLAAGGLVNGF